MAENPDDEPVEDEEFAQQDACIRGADCNRKQGLQCPDNCIWMQFAGERHPRCFGFHRGRGLVTPGTPEGALAEKTCMWCAHEMDCLVETCTRFGDDPDVLDKSLQEYS